MAIGLFGKLPSQGDFVSRRLPWDVTTAWDGWLQDGISQARARIGTGWNATYLTAPLWRLQLAPGVLGKSGWVGMWFASVDRVGRQFPLVLLEPLPEQWSDRYALIEQDEAFFMVEDAALRALDPRLNFEAFDHSLDGLSVLAGAGGADIGVARVIDLDQPAAAQPSAAAAVRIPADADAASALRAAQAAGPVRCCFFTWGNEQHQPLLLRCEGLPPADRFHRFLDGRWD